MIDRFFLNVTVQIQFCTMKNKVLKKHVQLTCGLSKGVVKRLPNKYLTCKYTVLPSNLTESGRLRTIVWC